MKTAYEVGLFNWNIGIYLSVFITIILIILLVKFKYRIINNRYNMFALIFALIILVLGIILGLANHYTQFYELKSGDYKIANGKILDFKKDSKGNEYFSVNGKDFILRIQGEMSQPFHLTDFVKELSDNNNSVKIYYSGEYILKVEYR